MKNNPNTKLNIGEFEISLSALSSSLVNNNNTITNKVAEPSRTLVLENTEVILTQLSEIIQNANLEISKHNQLIENLNIEKEQLIKKAWHFFRFFKKRN